MTIGVGAGQMSRVYSAKIAGIKAADENLEVPGSVMASHSAMASMLRQRPALRRLFSLVAQCEMRKSLPPLISGMAMVFTGMRHFRH